MPVTAGLLSLLLRLMLCWLLECQHKIVQEVTIFWHFWHQKSECFSISFDQTKIRSTVVSQRKRSPRTLSRSIRRSLRSSRLVKRWPQRVRPCAKRQRNVRHDGNPLRRSPRPGGVWKETGIISGRTILLLYIVYIGFWLFCVFTFIFGEFTKSRAFW